MWCSASVHMLAVPCTLAAAWHMLTKQLVCWVLVWGHLRSSEWQLVVLGFMHQCTVLRATHMQCWQQLKLLVQLLHELQVCAWHDCSGEFCYGVTQVV